MIALSKRKRRARSCWQRAFLAMLPTIRRCAMVAFRDLRGDDRDDAIEEVVANACVAYVRLVEQGRKDKAFATVLARFAVAQVRDGRHVGTPLNVRDVLSSYAQRKKQFAVERLDRFDEGENQWIEAVVEDSQTPILDQVWFRIDFPAWLSRLPVRERRIVQTLAVGHTTQEVAKRFRVSEGRISQLRREFHRSWQSFHGELDDSRAASAAGYREAS